MKTKIREALEEYAIGKSWALDIYRDAKDLSIFLEGKILDMVEIDERKTKTMLREVLAWTTEETNMDTDEILEEQARFLAEGGIIKVKNEKILYHRK